MFFVLHRFCFRFVFMFAIYVVILSLFQRTKTLHGAPTPGASESEALRRLYEKDKKDIQKIKKKSNSFF